MGGFRQCPSLRCSCIGLVARRQLENQNHLFLALLEPCSAATGKMCLRWFARATAAPTTWPLWWACPTIASTTECTGGNSSSAEWNNRIQMISASCQSSKSPCLVSSHLMSSCCASDAC
eukprot:5551251-Amphidinium_carterae.1